MTRDFIERNLIVNSRTEEYDGTTTVTRSAHLDAEEIEFIRWREERWMKLRHMPTAVAAEAAGVGLRTGRPLIPTQLISAIVIVIELGSDGSAEQRSPGRP